MVDQMETLKKVQALLGRTKAALPQLQDEAIETGDFSKLDAASQRVDKLLSIAQNISTQQGPAQPMPEGGGQAAPAPAPLQAGPAQTLGQQAASPSPAALVPQDIPPEIKESRQQKLPQIASQNRKLLPQALMAMKSKAGFYSDGSALLGDVSPNASTKELSELRQRVASVPDVKPKRTPRDLEEPNPLAEGKAEVLRLIDNIIRDEQQVQAMLPPEDPAIKEAKRFQAMKQSGALSPAEVRAGKINAPSPSALLPQQDTLPPAEGEPGEAEAAAETPKMPEIKDLSLKAENDFKGNPQAVMTDIMKMADQTEADERERTFLRRVNMELGQRPKRFTVEKLLLALSNGAGAVLGAWATGRYGGQALLDMDADQRQYDAMKGRIGSEVYGAYEARGRQAEAIASRERIAEAARKQREAEGAARDKVARFNARVRAISVENADRGRQMTMLGKAILERMESERLKIRSASEQAATRAMKPEEFMRIQTEAAARLEQLAADLESLASGTGE